MHMGSSPIVRTNKKGSPHSGGPFLLSRAVVARGGRARNSRRCDCLSSLHKAWGGGEGRRFRKAKWSALPTRRPSSVCGLPQKAGQVPGDRTNKEGVPKGAPFLLFQVAVAVSRINIY